MPPKPPGRSKRDTLAALRARVKKLEQENARRQREAAAIAEAPPGRPTNAGGAVGALRALAGGHRPAGHGPAGRGRRSRSGPGVGRPQPGIFLYDPDRRELEVTLREWDGTREPDLPRRRPLGVGLASAVLARRASLRTADYAAACEREGVVPVPEALALPHWLGVPIIAGDDVLGVLTLAAAARPFTEADERLLGNIASLTALALRSARLYEERSATYRELTRAQDHLVRTEPQACRARFPDVPVGLITGWGDHLDPAELARHGVRFVVAKPFEAAEVLHRVGDALAAVRET
jgi:hypothetical protein